MENAVAPDGSPLEVYLALPPGDAPQLIHEAVGAGGSILELGSGPGRMTHPLRDLGHPVVAVDNYQEMLDHIVGAQTVLGDILTLDLGKRFDAVVAASHLINQADSLQRRRVLDVCRRHVDASGVVLIERYEPEWAVSPTPREGRVGPVGMSFQPVEIRESSFDAVVTYELNGRQWRQDFTAAAVSDEMLISAASESRLRLVRWLDEDRTWALLAPFDEFRRTVG